VGAAFEIAEADRLSILLGQFFDLGADQEAEVELRLFGGHGFRPRDPALWRLPAQLAFPRLQGRPAGHVQQPGRDRLADPDRTGPAEQDEERRLEGVLGRG
jgi:hypothetical protein